MAHHEITFPTDEATVRRLEAGDTVTIQGHIVGIRDATQIRIFDQGQAPPIPLRGAALLHTAPNVRKLPDGSYEPLSIGTTTSARMSRFTEPLIRDHGARAIMGKGGLLPEALAPLQEHGGVYLAIVAGAAAPQTTHIDEIERAGDYIDIVTLGWGTSYVAGMLAEKLRLYRDAGIPVMTGGTLLEAAIARDRLDEFRRWTADHGFTHIEVSDGTIDLERGRKVELIASLAEDYVVLSEVGTKDSERIYAPYQWVAWIKEE